VAGVFILLQFRYCLVDILEVIKYISLLRLILRRIGLLVEADIKKLIAYSTIRHVSLIIYFLRFKLFKVVYFHLNIHAIFKSLIFICFGFVILRSFHAQDKRLVRLINLNPLIKIMYYFSCLCLAGLPIIRAFFSKDFIIEKIIEVRREIFFVVFLILFLGVRIYYSLKLLIITNVNFSLRIIEKNYIRFVSVIFIGLIIVSIINVYIRIIFSLRLELLGFKLRIYLVISIFLFLSVLTNLNLKFNVYDKIKSFKEV